MYLYQHRKYAKVGREIAERRKSHECTKLLDYQHVALQINVKNRRKTPSLPGRIVDDREKCSKTQTQNSFCSFSRQHRQKRQNHFLLSYVKLAVWL